MSDKVDSRFVFANAPKWKQGQNQKLQSYEMLTILPSNKSPTLIEFELAHMNSVLMFGPNTGFRVQGAFEVKPKEEDPDTAYVEIPAAEYSKVVLMPNWFENLVKSVDVFHNNTQVKCDDVPRYADTFLNTYLYSNMDKETKSNLFPESVNPARCVPIYKGQYVHTANSEWHNYSKQVFGKNNIEFRYVPTHVFPFFQQPQFGAEGSRLPAVLPMSVIEKLNIGIHLKEKSDGIFKKVGADAATNLQYYRFRIKSVELLVEEARLNPAFEKSIFKKTTPYLYEGVTRFGMVENIPAGLLAHRTELPKLDMPEGLFVFALPKKVIGGEFKYSDVTATSDSVFLKHNITSMDLTYNGMPLFIKTPNPGQVMDHMTAIRSLMDHKESPPFGIPQDPDLLRVCDALENGGKDSLFPHVYINLCPSRNETRLIAIGDDGRSINNPGEIHIHFKFGAGGATTDATYFIYAFYTDVNMALDVKSKSIQPYYRKIRGAF